MTQLPPDPTLPPPPADTRAVPLRFTGRGGEYFGIWIVNLLLSILTLGIYSAWAKVRRLQYFHRHTLLADSPFDYHGRPGAILIGRIIALVLLIVYNVAVELSPVLAAVAIVALALIFPPLLLRALRFRAHNTSWRGLRFAFDGKNGGAYGVYLGWLVLSAITIWLLAPVWYQRMKRYQQQNLRFGATNFSFSAGAGAFYRVYLSAFGLMLLVVAAAVAIVLTVGPTISAAVLGPAMVVLAMLGVGPYLVARLQNLVWNSTRIGPHRFESRVSARKLYAIGITNLIGIVFTLGLFMPFAAIRSARYRLESVTLITEGSLDDFVAGQSTAAGAAGEGATDLFDVDVAL
ncbi:MAG: YjgN family protein [Burkholderiaceae bacterium]